MTATKDIAARLEAWAAEVLDVNTFPEDPNELDAALPVVFCDIQRRRKVSSDPSMSAYQHEQRDLRLWVTRLTLLVAPDPSWQRTQELYDFTDQLELALLRDRTLGNRVEVAASEIDVEFPGEVEHPSGTVAVAAFFQVTVGESAEV